MRIALPWAAAEPAAAITVHSAKRTLTHLIDPPSRSRMAWPPARPSGPLRVEKWGDSATGSAELSSHHCFTVLDLRHITPSYGRLTLASSRDRRSPCDRRRVARCSNSCWDMGRG